MDFLGIDLGTNSIGWGIVNSQRISQTDEIFDLEDQGVIVFPYGVNSEKGVESSKAAERTSYRGARRLKYRRKLRKYETLKVLISNDFCPLSAKQLEMWRNFKNPKTGKHETFKHYPTEKEFLDWLQTDNQSCKKARKEKKKNPYYFRDLFSRSKMDWENNREIRHQLGRAFYHLAQRRGFLSNRLDQSDMGIIEKHKPFLIGIIDDATNQKILLNEIDNYFIHNNLDITKKKSKDLDAGQKELKKLYNVFTRIIKSTPNYQECKESLIERINKPENLGAVKKGISNLDLKIQESGFETIGQYFYSIYGKHGQENKIRGRYTSRESHYLKEFEKICYVQKINGILDEQSEASKKYHGFVKKLHKAIFYQRPLRSQKGLVGNCALEPNKKRCPVSRPEFEEFRMYSFINTVKIKTPKDEKLRFLNKDEKLLLIPKFLRKTKPIFNFEDLAKTLVPKACQTSIAFYKSNEAKNADYLINYRPNHSVSGCPTIAALISTLGPNWKSFSIISKEKNKRGNYKSYDYTDIWHAWYSFPQQAQLQQFAQSNLKLPNQKAYSFSKIKLKKDYSNLSLNAINKILPYLKEGLLYSHAVFMANMPQVIDKEIWENLDNRKFIESELKIIIESEQEANQFYYALNSYITHYKKNNFQYSSEADFIFRNEITSFLEKAFGEKKWASIPNRESKLDKYFSILVSHLKSRKYIRVPRLMEKIHDFLISNNLVNDNSKIHALYHPSNLDKFTPVIDKESGKKLLGNPNIGSVKNPVVIRALHQLKKLINTLIIKGKINKNTRIRIELARELNDSNKRKAIKKWQDYLESQKKIARNNITELYKEEYNDDINPTEEEILKYLLWIEQNKKCIYTNKTICLSDFIGKNPSYDIEHTIPRSLSLDNSKMNKTLCQNRYNRDVKKNKIPAELPDHEKILSRISHWQVEIDELENKITGLNRAAKTAVEKDHKDKIIQNRHFLRFKLNYIKGKYSKFILQEVKLDFKNSQISDTGMITRFATAYLKSVFSKVYAVNGSLVAEFRKAWGLQDSYVDDYGQNHYLPKNRSKHSHHCIDAITIACMSKQKYDTLAYAWRLEEKNKLQEPRTILQQSKPWPNFTTDLRKIEGQVFIVHHVKDKVPIQSKKKLRKNGKIQYNSKNKPILMQGDTVRGSLHKETFYGAIKKPKTNENGSFVSDDKGKIIFQKRKNGSDYFYVIRKELSNLKEKDIKNIVDPIVKQKILNAKNNNIIKFHNEGATLNGVIWMNKEKRIPINKVRIEFPSLKNPPENFKTHRDLSKHKHKQQYYVQNDGNYSLGIYEGENEKGKIKREYRLVNMLEAGTYFKQSNIDKRLNTSIIPESIHDGQKTLIYTLKKGDLIILKKTRSEKVNWHDKEWLFNRLYVIRGLDDDGIKMYHHTEARPTTDVINHMKQIITTENKNLPKNAKKYNKPSKLSTPKGGSIGEFEKFPYIKVKPNNFFALINKIDFDLSILGKIEEK